MTAALPTCPKCDSRIFTTWKYTMISIGEVDLLICAKCGAIITVLDTNRILMELSLQREALRQIAEQLVVSVNL